VIFSSLAGLHIVPKVPWTYALHQVRRDTSEIDAHDMRSNR